MLTIRILLLSMDANMDAKKISYASVTTPARAKKKTRDRESSCAALTRLKPLLSRGAFLEAELLQQLAHTAPGHAHAPSQPCH
jgi:hypothetical protein